jgi:hypothetical protein
MKTPIAYYDNIGRNQQILKGIAISRLGCNSQPQ